MRIGLFPLVVENGAIEYRKVERFETLQSEESELGLHGALQEELVK